MEEVLELAYISQPKINIICLFTRPIFTDQYLLLKKLVVTKRDVKFFQRTYSPVEKILKWKNHTHIYSRQLIMTNCDNALCETQQGAKDCRICEEERSVTRRKVGTLGR